MRRERGFTLIELLVVIAIIAILAAILFPVFARARENARKSTCQSNLKQLGTAVQMYMQDYDEYVPLAHGWGYAGNSLGWQDRIFPYVKNTGAYLCPSSKTDWTMRRHTSAPGGGGFWWSMHMDKCSYGYNFRLGVHEPGSWRGAPRKLAEIKAPADTMILADATACDLCWSWERIACSSDCCWQYGSDRTRWGNESEGGRHSGGGNIAYLDGHVKWLQKNAIRQVASAGCSTPFWGW